MPESTLTCTVNFTLTAVAIGSANQMDTLTLSASPSLSAIPSPAKGLFPASSSILPTDVYVRSTIIVDSAIGMTQLPVIGSQPPAGSLALDRTVSVFYQGILPVVSNCSYRIVVSLASPTNSSGAVIPGPGAKAPSGRIILFEDRAFGGTYRVIDTSDGDLSLSHGGFSNAVSRMGDVLGTPGAMGRGFLNDRVSSFIVVSGKWRVFKNSGFQLGYENSKSAGGTGLFGPGFYDDVTKCGVEDNQISSLWCEQP